MQAPHVFTPFAAGSHILGATLHCFQSIDFVYKQSLKVLFRKIVFFSIVVTQIHINPQKQVACKIILEEYQTQFQGPKISYCHLCNLFLNNFFNLLFLGSSYAGPTSFRNRKVQTEGLQGSFLHWVWKIISVVTFFFLILGYVINIYLVKGTIR